MWATSRRPLPPSFRVMLWTDGRGQPDRIEALVEGALDGGIRCVLLREYALAVRALEKLCERLRPRVDAVGGCLLASHHVDLAAAALVHGVHCNARSLHPARARNLLPDSSWLGYSAHDEAELALAAESGCDYATLSPIHPTTSKPGAPALGVARASAWTAQARLPVVWLGGFDAVRAREPLGGGAVGIAAVTAVCGAEDPRRAVQELVAAAAVADAQPRRR